MKAILCSQYCQPDDLVLADVPDPVAEPGQAVIAIKSAALNFFDILMIQGKYQIKPPFPFSPAAEVAGVIESVGAGVTDLKVGDRVVASCGHNGAREKIALPASSSSTARRCTRWKIAPVRSRVRPLPCSAPPAAPALRPANSAS
jgi:NADPH2:quinone reductase